MTGLTVSSSFFISFRLSEGLFTCLSSVFCVLCFFSWLDETHKSVYVVEVSRYASLQDSVILPLRAAVVDGGSAAARAPSPLLSSPQLSRSLWAPAWGKPVRTLYFSWKARLRADRREGWNLSGQSSAQ